MSDVTRYRWDEEEDGSPCLRPDPSGDYMLAADHLAALERVRVETLREVWAAVDRAEAWSREAARVQTKCLAAIDRLIDATTTPVEGS